MLNAYRQRLMQGTKRSKDSGYRLPDPVPAEFFPALLDTIDRFELPVPLFTDLLSAFEQDVAQTRYGSWSDVLDYCRRSANPIGRIVLRLNGQHQRCARPRLRRGVHGVAADELLAGPGGGLVARPPLRAGGHMASRTAPTPPTSTGARGRRPGARRWRTAAAGRARCSIAAGRSATASPGDSATSCARHGWAARGFWTGSRRRLRRLCSSSEARSRGRDWDSGELPGGGVVVLSGVQMQSAGCTSTLRSDSLV